jgi:cell division protein FtsL
VLSNAKSLVERAIVIECSTKQQDERSIKLKENSWAMPNRIHTIHVSKLGVKYKIKQEMPTHEIRAKIIDSIKSYLTIDEQKQRF